jgi:predicted DNA-binding transcriptional regulator YafY
VADLREVKREVLKYGGQVEVLSPVALRKEVWEEIEKVTKIYRSGCFIKI